MVKKEYDCTRLGIFVKLLLALNHPFLVDH